MTKKTVDFEVVREIAMALPHVDEGTVHGAPSWKIRRKPLACEAIHSSAEPNTLAVWVDFEQRARLIAAAPRLYYVTDHYVKHQIVLVRLSAIHRAALSDLLDRAWEFVSPKTKRTDG
jgi:hypothetical protein